MPQLNPTPWFLVLVLTWTVLILIYTNKTNFSKHLSPPPQKEMKMENTTPWAWPWS
uniref:ATP synthase complex subunit 8 n=2 Tax=Liolaemus TaxID=43599 RepID=A0A890A2Q1_9SAUR|nr:ATP synthase F0 subunit 8 [Liolaemus parthenos]AKJ76876.1 ATP synthase F0 subunit 8 [Liolaemus darwinii]QRG01391.1 ATP synthase F0 subunit 8 [Liolaemus parthenos]